MGTVISEISGVEKKRMVASHDKNEIIITYSYFNTAKRKPPGITEMYVRKGMTKVVLTENRMT